MNVGPLWIRISFDPKTGHLSSLSNMGYAVEVMALELVKLDVRDEMKKNVPIGRPIVTQHPGLQARRVDAT